MNQESKPKRRPIGRETVTTLLDIGGAVLVCGGVAAIYWPAALIVAGVALIFASWRATR